MDCKYSDNILYIIASLRSAPRDVGECGLLWRCVCCLFLVSRCSDALLEYPSREALRALFAFPVPHGMIYI